VHGSYAADLKPSRTLDIPLSLGLRGSVLSRAGDLSTRARVRSSWFESDVTASTTWRQPDDISATFEGRSKPALHPWMPRGIGFSGSARYAGARADLTTSLTLPGAEGGIRASAKVDLGRGTALPAINAVGDVVVDVSGLRVPGLEAPVTLAGKIRGGLRQGTARVDVVEPIEFHAAEAGIALRLTDPAPPILRADLSEGRLKAATISPKHIAATVQGFPLLLDDLVLNLGETTLAWQDANLRHDAKRPEFTPLRISGRIAWPDGRCGSRRKPRRSRARPCSKPVGGTMPTPRGAWRGSNCIRSASCPDSCNPATCCRCRESASRKSPAVCRPRAPYAGATAS